MVSTCGTATWGSRRPPFRHRCPKRNGAVTLSPPRPGAQRLQPLADLRLEAAVHRLVVAPPFGQVRLLDEAARVVVAVLVALAPAELRGPAVAGVAQVL